MKNIIACCLISIPSLLLAQYRIQGNLQDDTGQALAYANIILLTAQDSSYVQGEISGEDGSFSMDIKIAGKYLLQVSLISYQTYVSEPFLLSSQNPQIQFPGVSLATESMDLDEVQIVGQRSAFERKIDRLVVNPQSLLSAAGGTALEILKQSPGVLIDRSSGTINLFGKEGVQILINGKSSYLPANALVNYLQGIDASSIDKIELITSPPAHLDAQGNAGFINIVLKTDQEQGWNGNLNAMLAYGRGEAPNMGLNLFYRDKQWNVFANYSYSRYAQDEISRMDRLQDQVRTLIFNKRNPRANNHNYRLGFDWELNPQNSFGVSWSGYDNTWNMFANSTIQQIAQEDTTIFWSNREINAWTQNQISFHYKLSPDEKQQLNFDIDYLNYLNRNPTNYEVRYQNEAQEIFQEEHLLSDKTTPFSIWVAQLAYQKTISERLNIDAGMKWARFDFENEVKVELDQVPIDGFNDTSDLLEQIYAAYGTLDYQLNDRLLMKAGLRFEQTQTNLESKEEGLLVNRDFGNFFPSFFMEYKLQELQKLSLSYTRRINRPAFSDIAPFIIFSEPNTFFGGNPGLQAALSSQVQLNYQYKNIGLSMSYTDETNTIVGFQNRLDPTTNTTIITSDNLAYQRIWLASISVPFIWKNKWETRCFLFLSNVEGTSVLNDAKQTFTQNNLRLNISHNMPLGTNWKLELSGFYQSKARSGNVLFDALGAANITIQYQISQQSKLSFGVNDFLNTRVYSGFTLLEGQAFSIRRSFDASQTTFRLGFSHSFGKQNVRKIESRNSGAEEKGRLN